MATHYTERVIDREIRVLSHEIAALSIEGAKAVGKTSTALRIARTVHRLDDEAARAEAERRLRWWRGDADAPPWQAQ